MKLITIKSYKGDTYQTWALPKDVQSTADNRLSSTFEAGTADCLRGLTFEEEKRWLPNLIGISATDPSWSQQTREYWSNYFVLVPDEGLLLNIDLWPVGHPRAGEPENLQQYIMYRFILKDSRVAKSKEERHNKQRFYILDEQVVKKQDEASFELRNRANKAFMFLQTEKGSAKLEWVAMCLKDKLDKLPSGTNELLMFIEAKKDAPADKSGVLGLTKFLNVFNDDNLESKALLYKMVSRGVIERNGNSYFFNGEVMGNEIEAIHWLKNPVNSKSLIQMNERLKQTLV